MLRSFSVKGFKNFKDEIILDLSDVKEYDFNEVCILDNTIRSSITYGHNSSGKSNFGEAIFDIVANLTDKNKAPELYNNYLNLDSTSELAEFCYKFSFFGKELVYMYKKQDQDTILEEQISINNKVVVEYNYKNNLGRTILRNTEKLNLRLYDKNISFVKYIYKNTNLDKRNKDNKIFCALFDFVERMLFFRSLKDNNYIGFTNGTEKISNGILKADRLNDFEEFLKENGIDYRLIKNPNDDKEISCQFKNKIVNLFDVASSGTRALALFYFWYIRLRNASFVFIDEFDAFYHSDIASYVIKALLKINNIQFMLTTHNTDIMTNELLRPDCYFILQDGIIKSIANSTSKELSISHNLQRMYKGKAFEGVKNDSNNI